MKIGIVTDTHDRWAVVRSIVECFTARGVSHILHAGDIMSPEVVEMFGAVKGATLIGVLGNCDTERLSLMEAAKRAGGQMHSQRFEGVVGERSVLMGHDPARVLHRIAGGGYDLAVYGHTHAQDIHTEGGTLVVNPGARGVVIVETDDMTYETVPVE